MIQEGNYFIMQNNDHIDIRKPAKYYFLPNEEKSELPFSDYSSFHHGRPLQPAPVSYEEFLQPTLPSISSLNTISSIVSHSPPWVATGILPATMNGRRPSVSKTNSITPTFDPHESLPSSPFNSEELFKYPDDKSIIKPVDDYIHSHYGHSQLSGSNSILGSSPNTNSNSHINHVNSQLSNSHFNITPQKQMRDVSLNNWTKGKLLGSGGFGSVYVGLLETGEIIAVKEIEFAESPDDPLSKKKLLAAKHEIEIVKSFKHDNIVQYLGSTIDEDRSHICIFMEYVAGGSIKQLLNFFGPFSEKVVRGYTRQILLGLDYLHQNRVIHRDIKGANILVHTSGMVKLADFGCSKIFDEVVTNISNNKTIRGTPNWMAPEIIRGTGYGRSADIWSLGCTIIEMFTAKPPYYQFNDQVAVLFHIGTTSEPPEIPSFISKEGRDFISACLKRNANERPDAASLLRHPFVSELTPEQNILVAEESNQLMHIAEVESLRSSLLVELSTSFLPRDITLAIFTYLSLSDLYNCSLVCAQWADIINSNFFWQKYYEKRWGDRVRGLFSSIDWKFAVKNNSLFDKQWLKQNATVLVKRRCKKISRCMEIVNEADYTLLLIAGDDKKIRALHLPIKSARRKVKHKSMLGHSAPISQLLYDDGKLYSASEDKTIKLWDLKTKKPTLTLTHDHPITSLLIFNSWIAAGNSVGTIKVWDKNSPNSEPISFNGNGKEVTSLQFFNGNLISCYYDKTMKLWDLDTKSCVLTIMGNDNVIISLCADSFTNKLIGAFDNGLIRFWDTKCECVAEVNLMKDLNNQDVISLTKMRIAHGKIFAAFSSGDVVICDLISLKIEKVLELHQSPITELLVHDSILAITGTDRYLRIFHFPSSTKNENSPN